MIDDYFRMTYIKHLPGPRSSGQSRTELPATSIREDMATLTSPVVHFNDQLDGPVYIKCVHSVTNASARSDPGSDNTAPASQTLSRLRERTLARSSSGCSQATTDQHSFANDEARASVSLVYLILAPPTLKSVHIVVSSGHRRAGAQILITPQFSQINPST